MRRSRLPSHTRIFPGRLTGLLFAISVFSLSTQAASQAPAGRVIGGAYDAAHESTLVGTIQEVVTKRVAGSPAGMHLLVAGPQGIVDAHLGPLLTKETKEDLQIGTPVQIVGASIQLREKQYFLVREIAVRGHTITIRSARGFLVYPRGDRNVKTRMTAQLGANGGTR